MGKRGRGGKGKGKGENVWKHEPWAPAVPHSDIFVEYYKGQNIIPEEEWDAFYKSMQTPLPITFRVTASGYFANVLQEKIKQAGYHNPEPFEIDGEMVETPRPIPWYPNNLGWYTSIPRKALKKNPDLENFHKFLITQGDQGNITRQEAVSMLPPLFLDVKSHHTVLDMCAAPGSKTTQIIEMLHEGLGPSTPPKGLVIANDVEKDRCYMLVHHTKRLASPSIVVTNNPAQQYPRLPMRLDRILADVPCTGDGTLRKNVDLWRRWMPSMGPGLHSLQVRIAYRAAQMLAEGGRMVYSTCSLNPVEDEAVVMELLRQTGGALELVDVSKVLPALKYSPGISKWRMMDKDNTWYSAFNDVPEASRSRLKASCFQPTEEEAKTANLHHCLRLLPHHQNTGGFFIAVLHKKSKLPTQKQPATTRTPTTTTTTGESSKAPKAEDEDAPYPVEEGAEVAQVVDNEGEERPAKKRRERTWVEDPFLPLTPEIRNTIKQLQEFYGLAELPLDQIFTRSNKNHKLYFVTESIAQLINSIQSDPAQYASLTIINSGVKLFNKHENSLHGYRVCQESIQWILPLMTKRKVTITHQDLILMLTHPTIYPNNLSKPAETAVSPLEQGCIVFVVDPNSAGPSAGMGFVAWFGKRSLHLLIKKKELVSLRNLFVPKEAAPATEATTTTTTTAAEASAK